MTKKYTKEDVEIRERMTSVEVVVRQLGVEIREIRDNHLHDIKRDLDGIKIDIADIKLQNTEDKPYMKIVVRVIELTVMGVVFALMSLVIKDVV